MIYKEISSFFNRIKIKMLVIVKWSLEEAIFSLVKLYAQHTTERDNACFVLI